MSHVAPRDLSGELSGGVTLGGDEPFQRGGLFIDFSLQNGRHETIPFR